MLRTLQPERLRFSRPVQSFFLLSLGVTLVSNSVAGQVIVSQKDVERWEQDLERWEQDGKFPKETSVRIQHPVMKTRALLPFPGLQPKSRRNWPSCQAYEINSAAQDRTGFRYSFSIGFENYNRRLLGISLDDIWYPGLLKFGLSEALVFPMHGGAVYQTAIRSPFITLTRVEDLLPAEIRPAASSRCLSSNCLYSVFAAHRLDAPKFRSPIVSMRVTGLSFRPEMPDSVEIKLKRRVLGGRQITAKEHKDYFSLLPGPEQFKQTVRNGDIIQVFSNRYRVRNVVPPQDLANVGKIAGWIEIQQLSGEGGGVK